jgi:SAM-dependent methyltransferase
MAKHVEADYQDNFLYQFALKTKLWRHYKTIRGVYRTYLSKYNSSYAPQKYWDAYYSQEPVVDATTIDHGKELIPTRIHYNAIENIILSQFDRQELPIAEADVLDVGSGAGHWLKFYLGMGAQSVTGVEVSNGAATALRRAFSDDARVTIVNDYINSAPIHRDFDIVNAIGVMFHIVDDGIFEASVEKMKSLVKPGGCMVVGGAFGLLNNLNVQYDTDGRVTKRLRSYGRWKKLLGPSWTTRRVINRSYRLVNATLPEANVLFAVKAAR